MNTCGDAIQMFSQGSASIRRIQEVLDEKPEIFDRDVTEEIEKLEGTITFSKLTFARPPDNSQCRARRHMQINIMKRWLRVPSVDKCKLGESKGICEGAQ